MKDLITRKESYNVEVAVDMAMAMAMVVGAV